MGPEALDNLIIHTLHARGRQSLPELSADTGANAKDILRRLHVLHGQRRLQTGFCEGVIMYWLSGAAERNRVDDELERLQKKREGISTLSTLPPASPPTLQESTPRAPVKRHGLKHIECVLAAMAPGELIAMEELARRTGLQRSQLKNVMYALAGRGLARTTGWARGARWSLTATNEAPAINRSCQDKPRMRFDRELCTWVCLQHDCAAPELFQ